MDDRRLYLLRRRGRLRRGTDLASTGGSDVTSTSTTSALPVNYRLTWSAIRAPRPRTKPLSEQVPRTLVENPSTSAICSGVARSVSRRLAIRLNARAVPAELAVTSAETVAGSGALPAPGNEPLQPPAREDA